MNKNNDSYKFINRIWTAGLFIGMVFWSSIAFAQLKVPKGYSELTESPSNGKKMNRLSFYFDNDNQPDAASIIKSDTDFSRYKLLLYLTSLKRQFEIDLIGDEDMAIYPVQLIISNKNVLQFGYFLDGTSAFGRFIKLRYKPELKKVQLIGYDSGYRSSASGRVDKTFNLLTGKYQVKNTRFDVKGQQAVKTSTGVDGGFKNLYLDQFNKHLLDRLDAIGDSH
jgi:hypothetical protein